MAYIKLGKQIGDWITTTKRHGSMSGVFTVGSKVKIISIDPIRGYSIEDANGNRMREIGWEI